MNRRQKEKFPKSLSRRYVLVMTMLFIVAALSFACRQDNQNQTTQPGVSPSPQASLQPSPQKQLDGSPIIINGGSGNVQFDDAPGGFPKAPSNPPSPTETYTRMGAKIKSLLVDTTPCTVPASGDYTILIDAGGQKNDVTVTSTHNSVSISFDGATYGASGGKKHFNPTGVLKAVTVTPAGGGTPVNCGGVSSHSVITIHTQ